MANRQKQPRKKPNRRLNRATTASFAVALFALLISLYGCGSRSANSPEESIPGRPIGVAAAIDPKQQSTYVERALTHEREENWTAAVEDLRKVVELNPSCTADFDYRLGVALMKTKQTLEALKYFDQAAAKAERQKIELPATIHDSRAEALLEAGRFKNAITEYDQALASLKVKQALKRPAEAFLMERKAACLIELGDIELARQLKKEARALGGPVTNEFGKIESSLPLAVATENIAKAPTSLDAHHQRAHSYDLLKEHAKAINDLSYCVAKSPSRAYLSDRAKVLFKAGKFGAVVADCDRAMKAAPASDTCALTDLQLRCLKAKAQASSGKVDKAKRTLGNGVSFDELATSGEILFNAGDYGQATKDFSNAIHLAKTAKMHYLRGLAQRKVHHFGDTVYDFGQALSLQDGTLSYSERAQIAAMLKEFKTASDFYTNAIQSVELSDSELASALRRRVAARREQQSQPASAAAE